MIPYERMLSLTCAFSQAGKTTFWLDLLSKPNFIPRTKIYIFTLDGDRQYDEINDSQKKVLSEISPQPAGAGLSQRERGRRRAAKQVKRIKRVPQSRVDKRKSKFIDPRIQPKQWEFNTIYHDKHRVLDDKHAQQSELNQFSASDHSSDSSNDQDSSLSDQDSVWDSETNDGYPKETVQTETKARKASMSPYIIRSYAEFDLSTIEPGSFVLLDELNTAISLDKNLIQKIIQLYSHDGHHRNLSAVGLVQKLLGTPLYPLLSLSHFITIPSYQGSIVQLVRNLPLFPESKKQLISILTQLSDQRYWISVYYSCPYQVIQLNNSASVAIDPGHIEVVFSLDKNMPAYELSENTLKRLEPLLQKSFSKKGVAIIPNESIVNTIEAKKDNFTTSNLDRTVKELIQNSTDNKTVANKYWLLWKQIRVTPGLESFKNGRIFGYKSYRVGLINFLHALRTPSHLGKSVGRKTLTTDNIGMLSAMASHIDLPSHLILNKPLLMKAQRFAQKNLD